VGVTEVLARLLRRHWLVLVLAIAVPMVATAGYLTRQPATYTAHARVVATDTVPSAQAVAAALASQVQAIATSRAVVVQALDTAHLSLDPDHVIKAVTVTGLGTSALVDLAYRDHDPETARAVADALASAVVLQLDAVRLGKLPDVLKDVDSQLASLMAQRTQAFAAVQENPRDIVAQSNLTTIESTMSALQADRARLSEEIATSGHAIVVAPPIRPATADSRKLRAMTAVAALLGLVVGLIMIGIREALRPSASAAQVARLLDVPMMGAVGSEPIQLADVGRRIRLSAGRAGVSMVVLARASGAPIPPELVDRVAAATVRPGPVSGRIGIPVNRHDADALGVPGADRLPVSANGSDRRRDPDGHTPADAGVWATAGAGAGLVAVLAAAQDPPGSPSVTEVIALEELEPGAETKGIGLVVLAPSASRLRAVEGFRDLASASGWPVLGVLDEGSAQGRRTR
jgi:capsular polysaccharide biosynthesis protein